MFSVNLTPNIAASHVYSCSTINESQLRKVGKLDKESESESSVNCFEAHTVTISRSEMSEFITSINEALED